MGQAETGSVRYEGVIVPYEIIKSARKTMAVTIAKDGRAVVRIPTQVSYEVGHRFAEKNGAWMAAHYQDIKNRLAAIPETIWADGLSLKLLGNPMRLTVIENAERTRISVVRRGEELVVTSGDSSPEIIKSAVKSWYRTMARGYLEQKTAVWAVKMGVTYAGISVRDQATRWGSCSAKGNLSYNWKLLLLPEQMADYVVVHELAHRVEMNHSKQFWVLVEKILPDYRQWRKKLKSYETEINSKY